MMGKVTCGLKRDTEDQAYKDCGAKVGGFA